MLSPTARVLMTGVDEIQMNQASSRMTAEEAESTLLRQQAGVNSVYETLVNLCRQASNYRQAKIHAKSGTDSRDALNTVASGRSSRIPKKWRVPDENDTIFGELVAMLNNGEPNLSWVCCDAVWNLTQMLEYGSNEHNMDLIEDNIIRLLQTLQGVMLLHPRSRGSFSSKRNLRMLIDVIGSPKYSDALKETVIQTFVCFMVRHVRAIRLFEELKGPEVICTLFRAKDTSKEVKLRILEFLFFYLIPETNESDKPVYGTDGIMRKTTADKAAILEPFLKSKVRGLVKELETSKPFGELNLEW